MTIGFVVSRIHEVLIFPLFEIAGTTITAFTILAVVVLVFLTLLISRGLQAAVARAASARRMEGQEGSVQVAQRLVHYGVLTVGAVIALQSVGIDLGALVTAGAVFAVGVGLAMQSLAQNFVSGIILLVERSIKPGDIIDVDGRTVRVREMRIRSTVARTRDGEDLVIPNSILVQATVKNLTHDDRLIRVRFVVGVVYGADMERVREVLLSAARPLPWRIEARDPILLLKSFGSSSVDWEISAWAEDPWLLPQYQTDLGMAAWDALKAADISIAFPQLDVHFDPPVVEALRLVSPK